MLRKLFQLLCRMGLHTWQYADFNKGRKCRRCNKRQLRDWDADTLQFLDAEEATPGGSWVLKGDRPCQKSS